MDKDKQIAGHFGSDMTIERIAKLAGMTVEQYREMRARETVIVPIPEDGEANGQRSADG